MHTCVYGFRCRYELPAAASSVTSLVLMPCPEEPEDELAVAGGQQLLVGSANGEFIVYTPSSKCLSDIDETGSKWKSMRGTNT